jgi:hypothetical protein
MSRADSGARRARRPRWRNLVLFLLLASDRAATGEIVDADHGGPLAAYRAEARRLDAAGEELAIRGLCASACTIFLGLRKVCVAPSAVFWFHAARLPGADAPDPLATLEMLSAYPPAVRDWAIRAKALETIDFDRAKALTGDDLIRMGLPRCR